MARIRTIKPDFFISDTVSALPMRARLTWIGLWTHCDDYGRCRDNVKLVKAAVWPLDDVSLRDIAEDLAALESAGVLFRYVGTDGKDYLQITNWSEHQKVDRPSKSTFPAPSEGTVTLPAPRPNGNGHYAASPLAPAQDDLAEPSRETREDASSPRDRKGREGKGKGRDAHASAQEPPPPNCPQHEHDPSPPPCGACADARKRRTTWDREQAAAAGRRQSTAARERAEASRLAIAACRQCDDQGYVGAVLCAHDPGAAERSRRGVSAARASLTKGAAP